MCNCEPLLFSHLQSKLSQKEKKAKECESPPSVPPEVSSPPSTAEGEKRKLVTQDTLDSPSLSQTPSVSSEDPLSPVVRRKSDTTCFVYSVDFVVGYTFR